MLNSSLEDTKSRWCFQTIFIFTPIPGEMIQFDGRAYFSDGLVQLNHQQTPFLDEKSLFKSLRFGFYVVCDEVGRWSWWSRGAGRLMSMIAEPRSTKTWLDAFPWNPGCLI